MAKSSKALFSLGSSARCSAGLCILAVFALTASSGSCEEPKVPTSAEVAELIKQVPARIRKLSMHFETLQPLLPTKVDYVTSNDLVWDLDTNHYFCRTLQYSDPAGRDVKHVIIKTWYGKDAYFWNRDVDKTRTGKGMLGNEPEDSGTIMRLAKPDFSDLVELQEILFPRVSAWATQEKHPVRIDLSSHSHPGLPQGMIASVSDGTSALDVHFPSGWVLQQQILAPNGEPVVKSQISDFVEIPSVALKFPTRLIRTTPDSPYGKLTSVISIAKDSIKMGENVVFPTLELPPGTNIQDQITGTFKMVSDSDAAFVLEGVKGVIKGAK